MKLGFVLLLMTFVAESRSQIGEASLAGFPLTTTLWTNQTISVCWEDSDDGRHQDGKKSMVQHTIEETWQTYSGLKFIGWRTCSPTSRGIRILVNDGEVHVKGLGTELDGKKNGMVLNFKFNKEYQSCKSTGIDDCIRVQAVHEFGHAIGLAHEHHRPDKPGNCKEAKNGHDGNLMVNDYDPHSIMNYCTNIYTRKRANYLTASDIRTVQLLYGTPDTASSIVGGCNSADRIDHLYCISAVHRHCQRCGHDIGLIQGYGDDYIFFVCLSPTHYGDVPMSTLQRFHSGCRELSRPRNPACASAHQRWCKSTGRGDVGFAQEVGWLPDNNVMGVGCWNSAWHGEVPLGTLAKHDGRCRLHSSQSKHCWAAAYNYCFHERGYTGGTIQYVNHGRRAFGVACFWTATKGRMFIE